MRARSCAWAGAAVLAALAGTGGAPRAGRRVVNVTARRFAFTPPALEVRLGEAVTLRLTSADVTHGLFQRELGIEAELVPGRTSEVTFTPRQAGGFTAVCDHFCGAGHGEMRLRITVR